MRPSRGENVAPSMPSSVDLRHALMHLVGPQRFNRMAEAALQVDMRQRLGPGFGIVEPEVTLLPEADLVAMLS